MAIVVALRIYGQRPQGVLVAAEREHPALKAAGWVVHRDVHPRAKEMSPPRERQQELARVDKRYAYLTGKTAKAAFRQLVELPATLAYVWDESNWRRVAGDTLVTPAEAARLGLLADPGELDICAN